MVGMRDVAKKAGVSLSTVSLVGSARVFAHFGLRPSPWR